MEPYVREFVNTPDQVWQLNDLANESRRIFIDQEHKNVDGTHFAIGDSIGFWSGDMLIVHTVDIYPNDWFRGLPPTSNQFESVEVWRLENFPNGNQRLVVNVTFYDELSLAKPLTLTYTYRRRTDLEALGFRIRHWECDSNRNTYLTEDGKTQFLLPGDEGYFDIRGPRYTPAAGRPARPGTQSHLRRPRAIGVREMRNLAIPAIPLLALASWSDIANSHHSFSMFDRSREIVMEANVVRWGFNSPHVLLYVEDDEGTQWGLEGIGPSSTSRAGSPDDRIHAATGRPRHARVLSAARRASRRRDRPAHN